MSKDHLINTTPCTSSKFTGSFQILGGYLSPVSDSYNKSGLAPAINRVDMAQLAVQESDWIMVDEWESLHRGGEFTTTARVLDHFDEKVNISLAEMKSKNSTDNRKARVMLLAGGDLIESFQVPGLWATEEVGLAYRNSLKILICLASSNFRE